MFCKSYHSLTIFHCFTPWAVRRDGIIQWKTSNYDIYRPLHSKPILVNYPFYPTDCFWFLNSNLQCQNLLFSPCLYIGILGYLQNRIKLLWHLQVQIRLVQLFRENLYLGISCILVICLLNGVVLSLCALGCDGHWKHIEVLCFSLDVWKSILINLWGFKVEYFV